MNIVLGVHRRFMSPNVSPLPIRFNSPIEQSPVAQKQLSQKRLSHSKERLIETFESFKLAKSDHDLKRLHKEIEKKKLKKNINDEKILKLVKDNILDELSDDLSANSVSSGSDFIMPKKDVSPK